MYTIALMIQKGGGGKTTLGLNLACAAGADGKTALIIDLDPQATACNWSDRRKERFPNLQFPVVIDAQPARLQAALDRAAENGVDFAIIDTPARSEQSALAAAKAADLIIIPCRPQAYDLETVPNTREILSLAGGKPAFAVLNAVPSYGNRHDQARELLESLSIPVCPHTIGNRAAFGDAGAMGKSVMEFEPKGKGADEILQIYKYTCSQLGLLKSSPMRKAVNAR
jgi:chromosome partitioning protein